MATYSLTLRSEKGSKLTIEEVDNNWRYLNSKSSGGSQTYYLDSSFKGGDLNYFYEDLGSGVTIRPKTPKVDVNLESGDYNAIAIISSVKSLTLPTTYKDNLAFLKLNARPFQSNIISIKISDYTKLSIAAINPGFLPNNNTITKKFSFEITDDVIDLPNCGGLHLGGSKQVPVSKVKPDLTVKIYNDFNMGLSSPYLETISLDMSTWEGRMNSEGELNYSTGLAIWYNPNLTEISFTDLSNYSSSYIVSFNFSNNNLSSQNVDAILAELDNVFPTLNTGSANLYLNTDELSYNPGEISEFIVGNQYMINSLYPGDDFSNIGYLQDGVPFIATSSTPNVWSISNVIALDAGMPVSFTSSFYGGTPMVSIT